VPVFPSSWLGAIRRRGICKAHVSIAAAAAKLSCAQRLEQAGFEIVQVRHPTACVAASATIGTGVFLGPLTLVGPEARIEDYAQINNAASVAHHCVVGTAARLSDGVRLAGSVVVGRGAFLGLGVTVNESITIGSDSMVVSGVSLFDHVPPNSVVRVDGKAYPMRSH
jgi:UDP-3-O-[3-hydroxymyristoyl] glucosamine N-acyltransferase